VASIDPAGGARLYATLKPRIEEAHRDLGYLDTPFDRMLERAIVLLLKAPVQEGPVRVEPRGIVYGFADADLEELTAAQKQLLRMGPRNALFRGNSAILPWHLGFRPNGSRPRSFPIGSERQTISITP